MEAPEVPAVAMETDSLRFHDNVNQDLHCTTLP